MKKIVFISAAALLTVFAACKKDKKTSTEDPNSGYLAAKEQNSMIFYFGGNWCGPCGAYGKPTKETIHNTYGDRAVILSCQMNGAGGSIDPMTNTDANNMAAAFGVTGLPTMFVGANAAAMSGFVGGGITFPTVKAKIDEYNALSPEAIIVGTMTKTTTDVNVSAKVQFCKDVDATYYLSCHVIEGNLSFTQYNDMSTNKNIHDFVLRNTSSTVATGDQISTGAKKAKDIVEKSFTQANANVIKMSNTKTVLILWKQGTSGRSVVNSKILN